MMKALILAANDQEFQDFKQTQAALKTLKAGVTLVFVKNSSDLKETLHSSIIGVVIVSSLAKSVAIRTLLPTIVVPRDKSELEKAVPGTALVAIDGFFNAGILAAQILGCSDPKLWTSVKKYKQELRRQVLLKAKTLKGKK